MVNALVQSCKVVKHSYTMALACSVQLLGWGIVTHVRSLCNYVIWGMFRPFQNSYFGQVVSVSSLHTFIYLHMASNFLSVDVP